MKTYSSGRGLPGQTPSSATDPFANREQSERRPVVSREEGVGLDREILSRVGEELRAVYDSDEPALPGPLLRALSRLHRASEEPSRGE